MLGLTSKLDKVRLVVGLGFGEKNENLACKSPTKNSLSHSGGHRDRFAHGTLYV